MYHSAIWDEPLLSELQDTKKRKIHHEINTSKITSKKFTSRYPND